jgi:DNA-binding MarR family transcriptional regulator
LTTACQADNGFFVIVSGLDPRLPAPRISDAPSSQVIPALETLLSQVNALAIRLKQPARKLSAGLDTLPAAERAVLDIVHRFGAVTVPQIARERATSRQNIQILVDRLRAEGRVELVSNPSHKRSALVQLTEAGKQWFTANEPRYRDFLSDIEAKLGGDEILAGVSVLRKLQKLLSKPETNQEELPNESRPPRAAKPSPKVQIRQSEVVGGTSEEEFPVNLL